MPTQWFISDLHLSSERQDTVELFERFMRDYPVAGDRVFILGDLFDVWIGDDDDAPLAQRVRSALSATTQNGVEVAIQQGNRDFLMGKRLMRECGAQLLSDCHVTEVAGQNTLLMHGDLLCTDDVDYQKARRRFRNPFVRWFILRNSLARRRGIAERYRQRSRDKKATMASDIMDANDGAVIRYLNRYDVRQLIHGHTHRPAIHAHQLADGTCATRLVLPEWHGDHAVAWIDDGVRLKPVELK